MRASYSSFHCQIRSTSPSRPRSCRVMLLLLQQPPLDHGLGGDAAWSVPGIHRASKPCIRFRRMRMSCSVLFRAWPRCRAPVTLGGGMTMRYGCAAGFGSAVEVALLLPEADTAARRPVVVSFGKRSAVNVWP